MSRDRKLYSWLIEHMRHLLWRRDLKALSQALPESEAKELIASLVRYMVLHPEKR